MSGMNEYTLRLGESAKVKSWSKNDDNQREGGFIMKAKTFIQ